MPSLSPDARSTDLRRVREWLERMTTRELQEAAVEYDWLDAEWGRYRARADLCRAILRERGARVPAQEA